MSENSTDNTASPESSSEAESHEICKPLEAARLGTKKGRVSSSDTGLKSTERCRARTCDMLIKSQLTQNDKNSVNKTLESDPESAYKPAYKEDKKTESQAETNCPAVLLEMAKVWAELPDHIQNAILALIEPYQDSEGNRRLRASQSSK